MVWSDSGDIYMWQKSTGVTRLTNHTIGLDSNPSIDGDYVAFERAVPWLHPGEPMPDQRHMVVVRNVLTGAEQTATPDLQLWGLGFAPDIAGDHVVYRTGYDFPPDFVDHLQLYTLGGSETTFVAPLGKAQVDPHIDGDNVAWVDYRDATPAAPFTQIYWKPIGGSESRISTAPAIGDHSNNGVTISGDRIAWITQGLPNFNFIWAYSISKGVTTRMNSTNEHPSSVSMGPGVLTYDWLRTDRPFGDLYAVFNTTKDYVAISGPNRYETAAIAGNQFSHENTVVVTTAWNWPDAVCGSALAGVYDCPILLTGQTVLPAETAYEITSLGATHVIILGGEGAVSKSVADALTNQLGGPSHVTRIGGADRYATANMVAAQVMAQSTKFDGTFFVATGGNFPDALAAGPMSFYKGIPVFLSGPLGLSAATKASLPATGNAVILGRNTVVPDSVEAYLKGRYGTGNVTRLSGLDRYRTALAIADWGVTHLGMTYDHFGLVVGENFPDGVVAGPLQGHFGQVLLLTPTNNLDPYVQAKLVSQKSSILGVRFYGAVSQWDRGRVALVLR